MLIRSLFFAATLAVGGLALDLDDREVPYQCRDVCMSIVKLTKKCDLETYRNDAEELNCVCSAQNARTQIPLCEACVTQYDDDGADNDVNDLVRSCGFSYTTYNTASSSAPASAPATAASATKHSVYPASAVATQSTHPPSGLRPASSAARSTGTGSTAPSSTGGYNGTSGAPAISESGSSTTSGAPPENTGAASVNTVGALGVGLGVLGFAMGMM